MAQSLMFLPFLACPAKETEDRRRVIFAKVGIPAITDLLCTLRGACSFFLFWCQTVRPFRAHAFLPLFILFSGCRYEFSRSVRVFLRFAGFRV